MINGPSVYDSGIPGTIRPSPSVYEFDKKDLFNGKKKHRFVGVGLSKKALNKAEWCQEYPNHIQTDHLSFLTPYKNLIFVQKF